MKTKYTLDFLVATNNNKTRSEVDKFMRKIL